MGLGDRADPTEPVAAVIEVSLEKLTIPGKIGDLRLRF